MKTKLILLVSAFAALAFGADVTGKWTAQMPGRGGESRQMVMTLKADGAALTGTVSGPGGETAIADGKVDGDNVSFTVTREFNGNQFKLLYSGTVAGDEIHFTVKRDGSDRPGREFTAKRSAD